MNTTHTSALAIVSSFEMATVVRVQLGSDVREVARDDAFTAADEMVSAQGGGIPTFVYLAPVEPAPVEEKKDKVPVFSTFEHTVVDETAKARIEAMHKALNDAGIHVDASQQLFATGTRMAKEGYETQAQRKAEHDRQMSAAQAMTELSEMVRNEKREDTVMLSRDFGNSIEVNGKIRAAGLEVTEEAIRGLMQRLGSPALSYILGIRERLMVEKAKPEHERNVAKMAHDRTQIAEVLRHECKINPRVELKLRTRQGLGDIFAIRSPMYEPADAPEIIERIAHQIPEACKATYSYDPTTTSWELRAEVMTPTPVQLQAVGEPFASYVSFSSRDNGTGRFNGGGGVMLLRCLNASTYIAEDERMRRTHKGRIMYDIENMLRNATHAIDTLCDLWGLARTQVVEVPKGIRISDAIPGFWRHLLRDQSSELATVLPGRTQTHIEGLTYAYHQERRNPTDIVRADFGQAWTRYIQDQPTHIRRDGEVAVAKWLERDRAMRCELKERA